MKSPIASLSGGLLGLTFFLTTGCQVTFPEQPGWPAATPQRPTLSADTTTTAEDTVEFEAGAALADGGNRAIPVTVKYGASDDTETFLSWAPYALVEGPGNDASGIGDLFLGVRHRLSDETDHEPSLAVQAILKLPTADEDRNLGSGEPDVLVAGMATKKVRDWTVTGFAELDFLGDPDGGITLGQSVALAASTPLQDGITLFGELAGIFVAEDDVENVFTTGGVMYTPQPWIVFDAGLILGWSDDADDFGIVFGMTQNLGRADTLRDRMGRAN